MTVNEIIGVICDTCHDEAFQLFEREATLSSSVKVTLRVCKRCAHKIDVDNAAQDDAEIIKGMKKSQF